MSIQYQTSSVQKLVVLGLHYPNEMEVPYPGATDQIDGGMDGGQRAESDNRL